MESDLYIFGAGEFACIAYEYFTHDSDFEVKGFVVDENYLDEYAADLPFPPISTQEFMAKDNSKVVKVFVAIPATNLNKNRQNIYEMLKNSGYQFASYISSSAFVWHNVKIGENCFIFENNVLQPYVEVGNNVILWSGNHLGHRSKVMDHVFISSHVVISGYCEIGKNSFLGVNSTLNDGIKVAPYTVIGASAHLVRNTEEGLVYIGSPAKVMPGKTSFEIKF